MTCVMDSVHSSLRFVYGNTGSSSYRPAAIYKYLNQVSQVLSSPPFPSESPVDVDELITNFTKISLNYTCTNTVCIPVLYYTATLHACPSLAWRCYRDCVCILHAAIVAYVLVLPASRFQLAAAGGQKVPITIGALHCTVYCR